MHLRPCYNCPHKEGCEIKAAKMVALRGHGLTLVNFRCDKRLSLLQPGQRIQLEINGCWADPEYGGQDFMSIEATVMRPSKNKLLVWLDEETGQGRNPILVNPDRVTPAEGKVALCPECDQPEGMKPKPRKDGTVSHWWCHACSLKSGAETI